MRGYQEKFVSSKSALDELGIAENPMLIVFNKTDCFDDPGKRARLQAENPQDVWISARTEEGLDDLREAIYNRIKADLVTLNLRVPQAEGKLLSKLYGVGEILSTQYEGNSVLLEIKLSHHHAQRLLPNGRHQVKSATEKHGTWRTPEK